MFKGRARLLGAGHRRAEGLGSLESDEIQERHERAFWRAFWRGSRLSAHRIKLVNKIKRRKV